MCTYKDVFVWWMGEGVIHVSEVCTLYLCNGVCEWRGGGGEVYI